MRWGVCDKQKIMIWRTELTRETELLLLGLESILSHGESGPNLPLTQRLLASLRFREGALPHLRLGKRTANSTSLLHTEISRDKFSFSILLLQLPFNARGKPYSRSLLHVHNGQGASNILAHDLDLSKLSGSSSSNLGNTKLSI